MGKTQREPELHPLADIGEWMIYLGCARPVKRRRTLGGAVQTLPRCDSDRRAYLTEKPNTGTMWLQI
jgi:hypothetical protein